MTSKGPFQPKAFYDSIIPPHPPTPPPPVPCSLLSLCSARAPAAPTFSRAGLSSGCNISRAQSSRWLQRRATTSPALGRCCPQAQVSSGIPLQGYPLAPAATRLVAPLCCIRSGSRQCFWCWQLLVGVSGAQVRLHW